MHRGPLAEELRHIERQVDAAVMQSTKRRTNGRLPPGRQGVVGMGEVVRGVFLIVGFTLHNVTKGTGA